MVSDLTEKRIQEAEGLAAAGDWEEAKGIYEEILRREPAMREALVRLADVEYNRGRLRDSKRLYLEILRYRPFDVKAIEGWTTVYLTGLRRGLERLGAGSKWGRALRAGRGPMAQGSALRANPALLPRRVRT